MIKKVGMLIAVCLCILSINVSVFANENIEKDVKLDLNTIKNKSEDAVLFLIVSEAKLNSFFDDMGFTKENCDLYLNPLINTNNNNSELLFVPLSQSGLDAICKQTYKTHEDLIRKMRESDYIENLLLVTESFSSTNVISINDDTKQARIVLPAEENTGEGILFATKVARNNNFLARMFN